MMNSPIQADIVLSSNAVFTGLEDKPVKAMVAIKENKIIAVGSENELASVIGANTVKHDFGDELIMPGFNDFHVHLSLGSLYEDFADLGSAGSEEEAVQILKEFEEKDNVGQIDNHEWILGFGWYHVFWENPQLPTRHSLDQYFPNQPVCLLNSDIHAVWLNSKGLEVLGIDRDTPDPAYGKIVRDKNGEPTGILDETAVGLAKNAFYIPLEQRSRVIKNVLDKAAKYGVTTVNDILYLPDYDIGYLDTYEEFESDGKLSVRINLVTALNGELEYPKKLRQKFKDGKIKFSGLKQFVDGIPATYTAYFIDPYYDDPSTNGDTLIPSEILKKWVKEADKEGFRVRLHACGDGAIRLALDCYEAAREENGSRDSRHTIEHVETVPSEDLERFAELGVIASMQPDHIALFEKFEENTYPARLGPEREPYFPIKTLMDNNAPLAFGSDFPVVSLNPMYGVYRAITRVHNDGEPNGGWFPEEKITLAETLRAYTLGSSYASFQEGETGTLEVGKLADVVVLNKNLFNIEPKEVLNTEVSMTMVDGEIVYKKAFSEKI